MKKRKIQPLDMRLNDDESLKTVFQRQMDLLETDYVRARGPARRKKIAEKMMVIKRAGRNGSAR